MAAWAKILLFCLELAVGLVRVLERARLKAEGRTEANEEANAEQLARIEAAKAARADADAFASGELRDPRDRDNAVH